MLGLMDDSKKKASVIIGIMNKKKDNPDMMEEKQDQNPLVEKVFSSLSVGDKQGFQDAMRLFIKEVVYDLEMSEESSEKED